jgi:DNA modification methylase
MTSQVFQIAKRDHQNTLNELQGKEWIKFTKSWFVLAPPPRRDKVVHPASFPEVLAASFIDFFTKRNQWVLDPFAGTCSTLLAAKNLGRNSVGIELYSDYASLAKNRLKTASDSELRSIIIQADARRLKEVFQQRRLPRMDFCLTSPPYWNQLTRDSERQRTRLERGLKNSYGDDEKDLGLIKHYDTFLHELEIVFDNVYEVMAEKSYLTVVTNNIYAKGRVWPVAFDTFNILSKKWTPKDEKIWCQNDKKLFPFGMFHSWIGNRSHHYCLIFRK